MCDCISKLVDMGFVERGCVYEDLDYKEKGYRIPLYKKKGKRIIDGKKVFRLNYCPACGEKIQSV